MHLTAFYLGNYLQMALVLRQHSFSICTVKEVVQKFCIGDLKDFYLQGLEVRQVIYNLRGAR